MSNNPEILTYVPFAINGQKNTVPVDHVSGTDDRLASQRGGWPAICLIPKSAGGQPPDGMDLNGYLYQLSLDTVHRQSGKVMQFDAEYASNIGGYSKGALLQSTDLSTFWISTADKNLTDPDSSSASNWKQFAYTPIATSTTQGTVKLADTLNSTAKDTALTANQGNVLNTNKINYSDTVNNLTGTSITNPLSANMGSALYGMMLGIGQQWQDVSSNRVSGTSYTNNTGRPIVVSAGCGGRDANITITVDGVIVAMSKDTYDGAQPRASSSAIVPNGSTYICTLSALSSYVLTFWSELR